MNRDLINQMQKVQAVYNLRITAHSPRLASDTKSTRPQQKLLAQTVSHNFTVK